jgi:hypothetical protein
MPREVHRLMVPKAVLGGHIEKTGKHVQACRAELAFHPDEVGISNLEDRRQKTVMACAEVPEPDVLHPVSMGARRLTPSW